MTTLTRVALWHVPDLADDWLRFGRPIVEGVLDRRRSWAGFEARSVFAYVRWRGGDYGTLVWSLSVLQAGAPGELVDTVAGVSPGAEILLEACGEGPVRRAFAVIDTVEAAGFDPCGISADYWRMARNRLAAHQVPRPYGQVEHAAWLVRREIAA
jgi:hypothetical protein